MNRLKQQLHDLRLTAREWLRTEPEPRLAPAPPSFDVFVDTVHPAGDDSAEATVQAWLDAAVAPVPVDGCFHCDLPPGEHYGLRYAALVGKHQYAPPTTFQTSQRRRARDRAQGVQS